MNIMQAMLILDDDDLSTEDRDHAALAAWNGLTGGQKECLRQLLFKGPVWDGDICSKVDRGDLLKLGLAVRCCFKGEQGYTAATYRAYTIWKAGNREIDNLKRIARVASGL